MRNAWQCGRKAIVVMVFLGLAVAAWGNPPAKSRPPQEVLTGIYLINIFDVDLHRHSFYADFYLWFKWCGDRNPMNIEFVNAVDKWGATVTPFHEEAILTEDGYWYNGMRYEGRFYHAFELEKFPLDGHLLTLQIENIDQVSDSLVYVEDVPAAFVREEFFLPGWELSGFQTGSKEHLYPVNFGQSGVNRASYSGFFFQTAIRRPIKYFFLKLLLPLLIVIFASLGALLVHPTYIDARISLPIGGLLSSVFLQQAYQEALPEIGYMVLMDQIYLLAYLLIAATILRILQVGNKVSRKDRRIDTKPIRRLDSLLAAVYGSLFLLGSAVIVWIS